jgi:integrase
MPRKAHPWYRESRGMWFFTSPDGRQIPTGIRDPEKEADAVAARERILSELAADISARIAPARGVPNPHALRTVAEAVRDYLLRRQGKISAGAHRNYTFALATHFAGAFGARRVESLGAEEIEDWCDGKPWSSSYRNTTLGAVQTFLRWARHPLELKRPPKESRGGSVVLTDEQFGQVLQAYDVRFGGADFRELLRVLRETGARPQEVARLTVAAVDWSNHSATLKQHKTKSHGVVRVLYFPAAAMAILEAQRARYGKGYLFRTRAGNPYREKMIVQQMRRLSERVGFRAIAYGERHAFATKALSRGIPDAVVAELLGHKGTGMLTAHYAHLVGQSRVLKEAVEKVSKPA